MVTGNIGVNGVLVLLHVMEVQKQGQENAMLLFLSIMDIIVKETTLNYKRAIVNHVQVKILSNKLFVLKI